MDPCLILIGFFSIYMITLAVAKWTGTSKKPGHRTGTSKTPGHKNRDVYFDLVTSWGAQWPTRFLFALRCAKNARTNTSWCYCNNSQLIIINWDKTGPKLFCQKFFQDFLSGSFCRNFLPTLFVWIVKIYGSDFLSGPNFCQLFLNFCR